MANTTLLWQTTNAEINGISLDASISETHQSDAETTDSPVEAGVDVTDHYRPKPETLTMEAIVSDTPLPGPSDTVQQYQTANGISYSSAAAGKPGRARGVYDQLRLLQGRQQTTGGATNNGQVFTVVTALRSYDNMVLTSLSVPVSAKEGHALRFTMSFKQIQVVNSQSVQVASVKNKNQGPSVNKGKVAAQPQATSWALGGAQLLGLAQ